MLPPQLRMPQSLAALQETDQIQKRKTAGISGSSQFHHLLSWLGGRATHMFQIPLKDLLEIWNIFSL
jgi:hypothetical protein